VKYATICSFENGWYMKDINYEETIKKKVVQQKIIKEVSQKQQKLSDFFKKNT